MSRWRHHLCVTSIGLRLGLLFLSLQALFPTLADYFSFIQIAGWASNGLGLKPVHPWHHVWRVHDVIRRGGCSSLCAIFLYKKSAQWHDALDRSTTTVLYDFLFLLLLELHSLTLAEFVNVLNIRPTSCHIMSEHFQLQHVVQLKLDYILQSGKRLVRFY